MTLDTRLVAYLPNGASQGALPTPRDWSSSHPLNDLGALTLAYDPQAARAALLGQPLEVAVEVSTDNGNTWTEPPNARFLYLRDGRDPVKDDAYSIECPAYARRLDKAVVGFAGLNADGQRPYDAQAPGAILHDLLTTAQGRGALTGITWSFTATADSAGDAWATAQTVSYDPGATILEVLTGFADLGLVDWRFQGRTLQVYLPGGATPGGSTRPMSYDRTVGANPVTIRAGRDLVEAPFRRTWEGLADVALVQGDGATTMERSNAAAVKPWGRQETFVPASGIADAGTLTIVGDQSLRLTADARIEHTAGLALEAATHLPLVDYQPGHWVLRAPDGNVPEAVRVRQVTITRDEAGTVGGNVVLNDRFTEADVTTRRMIQALSTGTVGGQPSPPNPLGPDILAPAQATGLVASSLAYLDGAVPRAQVSLDWADVTTNADGSAASDVARYQVDYRQGTTGPFLRLTETQAGASSLTWSPFPVDTVFQFRVRAVDTAGNEGAWSATAQVTTGVDATPPATTAAPGVTSRLGVATVTWSGLNSVGGAMDADLAFVEVHASTVNNFTATAATLQGTMAKGERLLVGPLAYATTHYFRLVSVDLAGNKGSASAQTAHLVASLVDVSNFPDDAMDTLYARTAAFIEVTADMMQANSVRAMALDVGSVTVQKLAVGMGANIIADPGFESATASDLGPHLTVGGRVTAAGSTTGNARSGARKARLVLGTGVGLGNALTFNGGFGDLGTMARTTQGDEWFGECWVRWEASQGTQVRLIITQYDSGGFYITNSTTSPTVTTSGTYQRLTASATMGATTAYVMLSLATQSSTDGDVIYVDDVTFGMKLVGSLVVNGAIDGQTITAPIIRTTATANRGLWWTSTGLKAYNSSGVETFSLDAATGNAEFLGTVKSGSSIVGASFQTSAAASGNRIRIIQTTQGRIEFYSGDTAEVVSGLVLSDVIGSGVTRYPSVQFWAPRLNGGLTAQGLEVRGSSVDQSLPAQVVSYFEHVARQGVQMGLSGSMYAVMRDGVSTATTNGSGEVTVTHGMGRTPRRVIISGNASAAGRDIKEVDSARTSTTFTVRVREPSGSLVGSGTAAPFDWLAIA